jgi:hypothetical protein
LALENKPDWRNEYLFSINFLLLDSFTLAQQRHKFTGIANLEDELSGDHFNVRGQFRDKSIGFDWHLGRMKWILHDVVGIQFINPPKDRIRISLILVR